MDEIDIKLCKLLLLNSRTSYDELAGKLGLSINAVHKRVKALLELHIIRAFVARPSLTALNVITVWIFGRCQSKFLHDVHLRLAKNDRTYWVAYSGGEFLYVGGYLRDMSELESFVTFVKNETQMPDPTVGILTSMPTYGSAEELHQLDYQIISSLHKDSRKSLAEVASELHVTAKTVRNRLEKMIERQLVDLTMDWYPDASNDIMSIMHLGLSTNANKMAIFYTLTGDLSSNIVFSLIFANLPNQLVVTTWTNTMKQLEDLRTKIDQMEGVESVMLNVLQIGYSFDTWRDKMISEKCNQQQHSPKPRTDRR